MEPSPGPAEFSWSLRRRRMWNRCRREYFLHYYAARGGHDPLDAAPGTAAVHAARNRMDSERYLARLLNLTIREAFYAPVPDGDEPPPPRISAVVRAQARFEREFGFMLVGAPERDHRLPMLTELLRPGNRPAEIAAALRSRIAALGRKAEAGALGEFRDIPTECRRRIASPCEVRIGELSAYCAPLLAYSDAGTFVVVERFPGADGAEEIAILHKFFAMNAFHAAPEKVRTRFFDAENGVCRDGASEISVSAALRRIRGDVTRMLGALRPDGTAFAEAFPASASTTACPSCRFRGICRAARK